MLSSAARAPAAEGSFRRTRCLAARASSAPIVVRSVGEWARADERAAQQGVAAAGRRRSALRAWRPQLNAVIVGRTRMRILLVENHPEFISVVVPTFLSEHDVITVPSLSLARAALAGASFDAILVDYDLDDGKGDNLVAWISGVARAPAVVAISSHDAGNDALVRAGAIAVCSKLRFDQIGVVLRQIDGVR